MLLLKIKVKIDAFICKKKSIKLEQNAMLFCVSISTYFQLWGNYT